MEEDDLQEGGQAEIVTRPLDEEVRSGSASSEPVFLEGQVREGRVISMPPGAIPPVVSEPPRSRAPEEPSASPGWRSPPGIVAPRPSWVPSDDEEARFDRRGVAVRSAGSLLVVTSFNVQAVVDMLNVLSDAAQRFSEPLRVGYVYVDPGVGLVEIDTRFLLGGEAPGSLHIARQVSGTGVGLAGLQAMLRERGRLPLFGLPVAGLRSVRIWSASPGTRLDIVFPSPDMSAMQLTYQSGDMSDTRYLRGVHEPTEDRGLLKPLIHLATRQGIHSSLIANAADIEALQELVTDMVLGSDRHPQLPVDAREAMRLVEQVASERRSRRGD